MGKRCRLLILGDRKMERDDAAGIEVSQNFKNVDLPGLKFWHGSGP